MLSLLALLSLVGVGDSMKCRRSDFPESTLPISESDAPEVFETQLDMFEKFMEAAQFNVATGSLASKGEHARLRGYQRYAVARILAESPRSTSDDPVMANPMTTVSVPRKRGKSMIAAWLLLYWVVVHGRTAAVVSVTKDVASQTIMKSARDSLKGSPLRAHFKFKKDSIEFRRQLGGDITASILFLAAQRSLLQGYELSFVVVDESHSIPTKKLADSLEVLKSAGGAEKSGTTIVQISTSNKDSADSEMSAHPLFQDVFATQDGEAPPRSNYVAIWGHHDGAEFDEYDLRDYCLDQIEDDDLRDAVEGYVNRCNGGLLVDEAGEDGVGSLVAFREGYPDRQENSVPDWLAYNMNYFSRVPSNHYEPWTFLPRAALKNARAWPEEDELFDGSRKSITYLGLDGGINDDYTAAVAVQHLIEEDVFIVPWAKVWKPEEQRDHIVSNDDVFEAVSGYLDTVLADTNTELGMMLYELHYLQQFHTRLRAEPRFAGKYRRRSTSAGSNDILKNVTRNALVWRKLLLPREATFTNDLLTAFANTVVNARGAMSKTSVGSRKKIDAAVATASAVFAAEISARKMSRDNLGPVGREEARRRGDFDAAPEQITNEANTSKDAGDKYSFAQLFG